MSKKIYSVSGGEVSLIIELSKDLTTHPIGQYFLKQGGKR